jgi:putative flippase GtrA
MSAPPDTDPAAGLLARYKRLLQFGAVGASGVLVNMAGVWLGLRLFEPFPADARDALSSALGIAISILTNFLLNDLWTWGDREKGSRRRDWLKRLASYYVVSAAAGLLQFGTAMGLRLALELNLYLAQAVGIGLGTVVNYVVNNLWTFRDQRDPEG